MRKTATFAMSTFEEAFIQRTWADTHPIMLRSALVSASILACAEAFTPGGVLPLAAPRSAGTFLAVSPAG